MEINLHNDIEKENNSGGPLPAPHFDAAMVSAAQPVEPLDASRAWRSGSLLHLTRRRLRMLIAVVLTLLLGAAAFGMFLGLRDRQNAIEDAETANQKTPAPPNAAEAPPPIKAAPVKASARTQRAEVKVPEANPFTPARLVRRSVRNSLADVDEAFSQSGQKPAARKVGEIFGGGRTGDRHGYKGEPRRRERDDQDHHR